MLYSVPGPRLALVDADHHVHSQRPARCDELVDEWAGQVDGAQPHALPQLVAAAERRGPMGPRVGRVRRDERLGQYRQLCAGLCRLLEQADGLGDRRLGIEDDPGRLDRGDTDRAQDGHLALGAGSIRPSSNRICSPGMGAGVGSATVSIVPSWHVLHGTAILPPCRHECSEAVGGCTGRVIRT